MLPEQSPPVPHKAPARSAPGVQSSAKNKCYSARDCSGKVLNNRDAHNCKLSGGKSWRSGVTGTCTNL
jgi:hypothetical protein